MSIDLPQGGLEIPYAHLHWKGKGRKQGEETIKQSPSNGNYRY